ADHLLPAATRSPSHVTLDGRRSVDPLGRTLRYQWTQLAEPPSPRPVTLSGQGRAAVVTFTTELPGDYHFALRLCNGQSCSVWAPTLVRVERLTQRAPTAHLVARNAESGSTVDETRPPLVAQVFDAIELDAGGSTDPEPLDRGHLTYLWETPSGLQLTNPTTVAPAFLPNTTGTVQLGLRVRDPGGLLSKPVTVRVSVLPRRVAPRVQVNAVSADSGETGADLGDLPVERDHPRSLRVSLQAGVVTSVTLKAVLRDADPTIPVTFSWRRLSGPEFEIFGESSSTARVRPTTPGVYELEVAVSPRGTGSDDPTKVTTRSRIRFLAETAQVHLPSATATVLTSGGAGKSGRLAASGTPPVVAAGQRVELDGRDSRATQVGRRIMTYRWEQVAGPEVVLSDPASSVLTFFAPDTHDGWSHDVVFHLYVDDGVSRSEAEPVCLRTRPPERAQGQMPLAPGLNLVAFPVEPLTPSEHTLSAGPIASLLSAGCLVRTTVPACGGSSYWPLVPGLTGDFSVEPGRGYLVQLPARAGGWTPLSVDGRAWSESGHQVVLSRGVNLVGLPGRPATTVTAAQFAASTGANFVAQLVARSPGPPRFEVLWAGAAVQSQTMLATGRGYVVSVPSSRLVSLP
ncbi:MAG: hypothetical protein HY814_09925, partial [Candidatus Riflebacteria bacterium]|nr:hypothetical protein [Candidatus Riflebacteria bacterium]